MEKLPSGQNPVRKVEICPGRRLSIGHRTEDVDPTGENSSAPCRPIVYPLGMSKTSSSSPRSAGRPKREQQDIDVAARIKQRREALNFSAQAIADAFGISVGRYRYWEKCFGPALRSKFLARLADALKVAPAWLETGDEALSASPLMAFPPSTSLLPAVPLRSLADLTWLATRARNRRIEIHLPQKQLAESLGIVHATLTRWELRLPDRLTPGTVILWEKALSVPHGWMLDKDMTLPEFVNGFPSCAERPLFTTAAQEILAIGCWLSRSTPHKRTYRFQDLTPGEQRHALIFAMRYGTEGEDNSVLQVIGDRFGLTRERIRQIMERRLELCHGLAVDTPCIDSLIDLMEPHLPAPLSELEEVCRGVLGDRLSLVGVERFAREILGKSIMTITHNAADMCRVGEPYVVKSSHDAELVRTLREEALWMIRSVGAAHLHLVTGAASAALGRAVSASEASRYIQVVEGFEWLAEDDGWFWLGPNHENRVFLVVRKILAVAQQKVDVADIAAALLKSWRERYDSDRRRPYLVGLPTIVLNQLLARLTWLRQIQQDDYLPLEPIAPGDVLSSSERAVYHQLVNNRGVSSRYLLTSALVPDRVSFMSLSQVLAMSPICVQMDYGVFALIGAKLSPPAIATAFASVGGPDKGGPLEIQQTENGAVTCTLRFNPSSAKNSYFCLPVTLAQQIPEGEYRMEGFDEPVEVVRLSGGSRLRRFSRKLSQLGFSAEDEFRITIHPEHRTVIVHEV